MIVTCPNCGARYRLDVAVVARRARLKCAECSHRFVPSEDIDEDEAVAEVQAEMRAAATPAPEAPPPAEVPVPELPSEDADTAEPGFAWGKTLVAIVLGAALMVAAGGLWVGRLDPAGIPALAPVIARIAPPVPALKVMVSGRVGTLASGQTILEVGGTITNPARESQAVPELVVRFTGADSSVRSWTIAPPAVRLSPGASTGFSGTITGVPAGPGRVEVALAR